LQRRQIKERHEYQEPSKEIKAVVDSVLGAFNSKNSKLFNDPFSGEVAIINGFASLGWTGPNAQARWWAEAERWGEELGGASEGISLLKRRFTARWLELAPTLSFQRRLRLD